MCLSSDKRCFSVGFTFLLILNVVLASNFLIFKPCIPSQSTQFINPRGTGQFKISNVSLASYIYVFNTYLIPPTNSHFISISHPNSAVRRSSNWSVSVSYRYGIVLQKGPLDNGTNHLHHFGCFSWIWSSRQSVTRRWVGEGIQWNIVAVSSTGPC